MKNKQYILYIVIVALIFLGFKYFNNSSTDKSLDNVTVNIDSKDNNIDKKKQSNKLCDWIDESDVVIQLNLPEEYGYYNDKTVSPSYSVGFMFKSSYGDIARMSRLARKSCDYRVGFSKVDFEGMNYNPDYPIIILAERGSSDHFSYNNEPQQIILVDNLPKQDNKFILEVTGEVPAFGHYSDMYK